MMLGGTRDRWIERQKRHDDVFFFRNGERPRSFGERHTTFLMKPGCATSGSRAARTARWCRSSVAISDDDETARSPASTLSWTPRSVSCSLSDLFVARQSGVGGGKNRQQLLYSSLRRPPAVPRFKFVLDPLRTLLEGSSTRRAF